MQRPGLHAATSTPAARALANRLLVEADAQGFPLALLSEPVEAATKMDWRGRYAQAVGEVIHEVEQQWSKPTGLRRWLQTGLVFLADWLPPLAFLAACIRILWLFYVEKNVKLEWSDFLLPVVVLLTVLVVFHILITLVLPLRWRVIRSEFRRQLERPAASGPGRRLCALAGRRGGKREAGTAARGALQKETQDVADWLKEREQSASVVGLYGK